MHKKVDVDIATTAIKRRLDENEEAQLWRDVEVHAC
jgi:hypothetical protein